MSIPAGTSLMEKVQRRLVDSPAAAADAAELARLIREEAGVISDVDVLDLLRRLRHDSTGVGLLEAVLSLDGITDIVVNGPDQVWFDRGAGLERAEVAFADDAEVRQLATRLARVAELGGLPERLPGALTAAARLVLADAGVPL